MHTLTYFRKTLTGKAKNLHLGAWGKIITTDDHINTKKKGETGNVMHGTPVMCLVKQKAQQKGLE